MLLQKQKQLPYIHIFKLTSGEEIIAKVVKDEDGILTIDKPLTMAMGQRGLQFAPFMVMCDPDKTLELHKDKISASAEPMPGLEGQYESVTTGIALPQKSTIFTP